MNEELLDKAEDTFEEIPEEVRDFIFGEDFKKIFNEIVPVITQEEKDHLEIDVKMFLIGAIPLDEIILYIDLLNLSKEDSEKLKSVIQEKVLDEIKLIIEVNKDLENNKFSDDEKVVKLEAPSPSDMVTRLNQTLKQPTTIAPVRRDYSLEKGESKVTPSETQRKISDPYREIAG